MTERRAGERHAIELACFDGYAYREVAMMLDTPEGKIKGAIRSGLNCTLADLVDTDVRPPWRRI